MSIVQRPAVRQQQPAVSSSSTVPPAIPSAPTVLTPALEQHPAIRHLRQLHPQLDNEQLLAIAYEALLSPPNQSPKQPTPPFPPPTFPPLSVIACPGSGKTLTLAARIAFFISYHRVPAHQILAITFTRKAKAELVDRVSRLIQHERTTAVAEGRPPPCSDGLRVSTFSALALKYLQRYATKFGWRSSLGVVKDDKEIKHILRDIVERTQEEAQQKKKAAREEWWRRKKVVQPVKEEVSKEEPSRWGADDADEDEMMRVLNEVEKVHQPTNPPHLHTAAALQPHAAALLPKLTSHLSQKALSEKELTALVNTQFFHIKSVRLRAGLVLKPRTASQPAHLHTPLNSTALPPDGQQLCEDDDLIMHELLRAYDARLHETARLGRGDFIPALLALLRADEEVLGQVRSEWRAVFVDEVQDSSRSDLALLLALVGCEQWKDVEKRGEVAQLKRIPAKRTTQQRGLSSHLCLVGDPQQCIYGFRDVDPQALDVLSAVLDRHGLVKLRLSTNYRSTQHIVNTAVAIIASNGVKAEQKKRKSDEIENDHSDEDKQAEEQQLSKKPSLTATFTKASFNTQSVSGRAVLSLAKQPGLSRPHIPSSSPQHASTALQPIKPILAPAPPPSAVMRTTNEAGERIIELRTDGWQQEARCIADRIRTLTSSSSYGRHGNSYRYTDIAILARRNYVVDLIKKHLRRVNVPVARLDIDDDFFPHDNDSRRADEGSVDGVHVLTVHKAKGLEWPVVFVASFSEGEMPLAGPTAANDDTDALLQRMFKVNGDESGDADDDGGCGAADVEVDVEETAAVHDREECRVAYVAVTRARRLLFLCHSREDDKCRGMMPSRYLSHIPTELRSVQDECVKVEMAGDGARNRSLSVFSSALGPSGAAAFRSAGSRGRGRPVSGRPVTGERRSASGVKREAAAGGGTRTAVAAGWTTAASMTAGGGDEEAGESADDGVEAGFQRASTTSFERKEAGSGQVKQE